MSESSTPTRPMVMITRHGPGGHIAELALDRPEAMNAMSTQMARELGAACAELTADLDVRVVVITSTSPKAFCVGADLKERNSFTDADLMEQRPVARAAYGGVLNLPMPSIAVVEGSAVGGGFGMACCSDVVILHDEAELAAEGASALGRHRLAPEQHPSGVGSDEADHEPQQRRFAADRRPDQDRRLARRDHQVGRVDGDGVAVGLADAEELEHFRFSVQCSVFSNAVGRAGRHPRPF